MSPPGISGRAVTVTHYTDDGRLGLLAMRAGVGVLSRALPVQSPLYSHPPLSLPLTYPGRTGQRFPTELGCGGNLNGNAAVTALTPWHMA